MSTATNPTRRPGRPRRPDNIAWLLGRIADGDVARDPHDFQYWLWITADREDARLCTAQVEALAERSWGRHARYGRWPRPLVRLRKDGLVDLTDDGEKVLAAAKAKAATPAAPKLAPVPTKTARATRAAAVEFQAA